MQNVVGVGSMDKEEGSKDPRTYHLKPIHEDKDKSKEEPIATTLRPGTSANYQVASFR